MSRGLFPSRAKAAEAIAAGLVVANGKTVAKASDRLSDSDDVSAEAPYPWVSRGGVKLAAALDRFGIRATDRDCADIGASTGGFTDVLLAHGARHVTCVDVGRDQLHPRIGGDGRVTARESLDARTLSPVDFNKPPELIVVDVSFISLTQVLPAILPLAAHGADLVVLVKPQFEGAPNKKGIVRDEADRAAALDRVVCCIEAVGWIVRGTMASPIAGGDGNIEFLLYAQNGL